MAIEENLDEQESVQFEISDEGVEEITKGSGEIDPVSNTSVEDEELLIIPDNNGFILVQRSFLEL